MALISDKTLERLARDHPDRKNRNPWNLEKVVPCADLLQRYKTCKQMSMQETKVEEACKRLKKFTYQCYTLEEKYFIEYIKGEMTEEQYFDKYMSSVASSIRIIPRKQVWKQRMMEGEESEEGYTS